MKYLLDTNMRIYAQKKNENVIKMIMQKWQKDIAIVYTMSIPFHDNLHIVYCLISRTKGESRLALASRTRYTCKIICL